MISSHESTEANLAESFGLTSGIDLPGLIRRRKWIVAFGFVVCCSLSVLFWAQATPIFESEAELLVIRKNPNLPVEGVDGAVSNETRMMEGILATHMSVIRSPRIVESAITKLTAESPEVLKTLPEDMDATEAIIDELRVTKGGDGIEKDAHVLNVYFRSIDPDASKKVVAAVTGEYQDFIAETYQDVSREAVDLITEAKKNLEEDLKQKNDAYIEFRRETPLHWGGDGPANIHQQNRQYIAQQRQALRKTRIEVETKLDAIEKKKQEGADPSALVYLIEVQERRLESREWVDQNPRLTVHDHLLELYMERDRLLGQGLLPNHEKVRKIQSDIKNVKEMFEKNIPEDAAAKTEDELKKYIDDYVAFLQVRVEELKEQDRKLAEFYEAESKAAGQLVEIELEDANRLREIENQQKLFDATTEKLGGINLVKAYGGFRTEVLAAAAEGEQVWPSLPLLLIIGGFACLFVGFGLATLVDLADKSFRSPADVQRRLGLPVISHIPTIATSNGKLFGRNLPTKDPQIDTAVHAFHRPMSREAETFRGVRTALFFQGSEQRHKVIQVTSPRPSDGKTTLVANLGASIAQSGKSVILVDADFRRPRLDKIFPVDASVGLATVLSRKAKLVDAIQETSVENLLVLPAGPHPHNPAELLTTERFRKLLGALRERYDFVLIDTPPLLAVTDPCSVAVRVDGVLLVLRIAKNGFPDAKRAANMLSTLGANVLGAVVNGVGRSQGYRGYGRSGYRHYQYGYGGDGYDYGNTRYDEYYQSPNGNGKSGA